MNQEVKYELIRHQEANTSLFSLKLNTSLKNTLRRHSSSDVGIEFSSLEEGFIFIGDSSYPFTVRDDNAKECFTVDSNSDDTPTLSLLGSFSGRMTIHQETMNDETAAALKKKTETARAERAKRKVITMSDDQVMGNKKIRSRLGTSVTSQSLTPSISTLAGSSRSIPSASRPSTATASATPLSQLELQHNWVVLRSLPCTASARDVETFLDGISIFANTKRAAPSQSASLAATPPSTLSLVPAVVPGTASRDRSGGATVPVMMAILLCDGSVGSPQDCSRMDVYVELLTAQGAVLAEKRSGEPLRCAGWSDVRPLVQRNGGGSSLSLAELHWARGLGVELFGRRSALDIATSLVQSGVPAALVFSPQRSLAPGTLCGKWRGFAQALVLAVGKQRTSQPYKSLLTPSLRELHADPIARGGKVSDVGRERDTAMEDVSSLLDGLGHLWVALSLTGQQEKRTSDRQRDDTAKSSSLTAAVHFVSRAIEAFSCLDRFLRAFVKDVESC